MKITDEARALAEHIIRDLMREGEPAMVVRDALCIALASFLASHTARPEALHNNIVVTLGDIDDLTCELQRRHTAAHQATETDNG